MANRTITALYETRAEADDAKTRLAEAGVTSVDVHDNDSSREMAGRREGGFMADLKNLFGAHDDTHGYAEGVRRGHALLTAHVDEADADLAVSTLEDTGAIDFDRKQAEWRSSGWTPPQDAPRASTDDKIDVIEERLVVGKREVERGGVRVRSYVVETPVSESVTLRDEQIDVQRTPVDRLVAGGEDPFRDRTIEMTETSEEAVVGKEARVKEEIVVRKDIGQRTEEIRDTVRHTEVEVDRTDVREKDKVPV